MINKNVVTTLVLASLSLTMAAPSFALELFAAKEFDGVATLPGSSLGAPSGMVSSWGSVFAALGGLTHSPVDDRVNGSFSAGMGFGDPIKSIGATVSVALGSINPRDGGAGERGAFNVSIGTFSKDWQLGIAIGGVNVGGWNKLTVKPKSSSYVAITKIFPFNNHPVIVNIGAGTNAFADISVFSDATILEPEKETGGFIGMGIYLTPQISLIVDSTAGIVTAGTSLVPVDTIPLVITLGAFDINKEVPNHDKVSFIGSIAYSFRF